MPSVRVTLHRPVALSWRVADTLGRTPPGVTAASGTLVLVTADSLVLRPREIEIRSIVREPTGDLLELRVARADVRRVTQHQYSRTRTVLLVGGLALAGRMVLAAFVPSD